MLGRRLLSRGVHTLPKLPFPLENGVGAVISAKQLDFHYNKHHAAYVTRANTLIKGTQWESKTLEQTIIGTGRDASQAAIFNNTAQIWNHTFYWNSLTPSANTDMPAVVKTRLEESFGSVDAFKQKFSESALALFGSGWTWLVEDKGKLNIVNTSNAGNPMVEGKIPLLTVDVWEHAYYLDHQNRRVDYVNEWWKHVNWKFVSENLAK
ncbi:mitochondrial iron/manganese superoxide dismutase [Andalucia godoyi]|uniref:Superoxide dismutase n=1 Tax=Andalucia godoyi TaxID=505711 RepID=A0A8K0AIB2_ANDGO|nr:mitochondrial iron/manganese superoxide dismutase [Andalucia godoyi]|eukprot:ANDGO_06438.mRNA.1 mitochondrial iron/manganese superoxide dismutase